jgi:hypothetical protein
MDIATSGEIAIGTVVGFTASQFALAFFISNREARARKAKLAQLAAMRAEFNGETPVRVVGETPN